MILLTLLFYQKTIIANKNKCKKKYFNNIHLSNISTIFTYQIEFVLDQSSLQMHRSPLPHSHSSDRRSIQPCIRPQQTYQFCLQHCRTSQREMQDWQQSIYPSCSAWNITMKASIQVFQPEIYQWKHLSKLSSLKYTNKSIIQVVQPEIYQWKHLSRLFSLKYTNESIYPSCSAWNIPVKAFIQVVQPEIYQWKHLSRLFSLKYTNESIYPGCSVWNIPMKAFKQVVQPEIYQWKHLYKLFSLKYTNES